MDNIAKYKIGVDSTDKTYKRFKIAGLKKMYHTDSPKNTDFVYNGACCLIKNADHEGYCNLCMVYHSHESERFENGYTIQFAPLYNEEGKIILVEYDRDETFGCILCGYETVYDKMTDATLTVWKHGTFTDFKQK